MSLPQLDVGIQTAARSIEATIGRHFRRDQRTIACEFDAAGVGERIGFQTVAQALAGDVDEGAIQSEAGESEKGDEAKAGREKLARLQRPRLPAQQRLALSNHEAAVPTATPAALALSRCGFAWRAARHRPCAPASGHSSVR